MTPPPHRLTSLERLHPLLDRPVLRPVVRLVTRTATGLVQLQIFDRAMTLAAQAFTSIFPVLILSGALLGSATSIRLADVVNLPPASRSLVEDAMSNAGPSAFGVVGSLVVLLSSTGLARALTRAYATVWTVRRSPTGPRAAWRWLAVVLALALFAVGTRLLGRLADTLPLPHLASAILLLLADCALSVFVPRLLLGSAVPVRLLLPGGVIFALIMVVLRPVGAVYLPRALQSSADRYGTIGVAFTYIGWLYVVAFCLLLASVLGRVILPRRAAADDPPQDATGADPKPSTPGEPDPTAAGERDNRGRTGLPRRRPGGVR
jgi:membrane protein